MTTSGDKEIKDLADGTCQSLASRPRLVIKMATDWMWCYEDPEAAAGEIDRLRKLVDDAEAVIRRQRDRRIEQDAEIDRLREVVKYLRAILPQEKWADDGRKMADAALGTANQPAAGFVQDDTGWEAAALKLWPTVKSPAAVPAGRETEP